MEDEQVEVEEVVEEIEEVSDYEEVDSSDDEDVDKTGVDQTAAATLRAQAAFRSECEVELQQQWDWELLKWKRHWY